MQNLFDKHQRHALWRHLLSPGSWKTRIMLMVCIGAWYACVHMLQAHNLNPLRGAGLLIFGPTTILLTYISIIALRWDPWMRAAPTNTCTRTHRLVMVGGVAVALVCVLAIALLKASSLLLPASCIAASIAAAANLHAHRDRITQTMANTPGWRRQVAWVVMGLVVAWWGSVPVVLLEVLLSTHTPLS